MRRAADPLTIHDAAPGIYLEVESFAGIELAVDRLDATKGVEVVAVREAEASADRERRIELATLFVPDGATVAIVDKLDRYSRPTKRKKGERRHEAEFDRVAAFRLAVLESIFTDDPSIYPSASSIVWWEVWLRRTDGRELERFSELAALADIRLGERRLEFGDRIIVLALAAPAQLARGLDAVQDLAEVRRAKELATFFLDQDPVEQAEWAMDLRNRLVSAPLEAPAVCIVDTGISRAHPILESSITPEDVHAADPRWGGADDGGGTEMRGHGTEMAGLALLGDLAHVLPGSGELRLRHRLESVKLLPPKRFGENRPELYGALTATAVSYPEVTAPERRRVFSMAVTSDGRDRGQPTSWSAAVDALAAGRTFDPTSKGLVYLDAGGDRAQRLFVLSAGNVLGPYEREHLVRSALTPIQDPAQAWNALTVGAYTERARFGGDRPEGWEPLAPPGELSPFSATSCTFVKGWPMKPDVVAEGGNVAFCGGASEHDSDLLLLTTHGTSTERLFVTTSATSAACAQVAGLCARLMAEHPTLWPETIRALVVHSAEWTPAMRVQFERAPTRASRVSLVRRYGFGVPSYGRAVRSARDALTLIVQERIRPFQDGKTREMHVFELPWPKAVLESLGAATVRMRVTLSYFVDPNPARVGWKLRHRYASHHLRFAVKRPLETLEDMRKHINALALADGEARPKAQSDDQWFLGKSNWGRGSLHADIWTGSAADLAERGAIIVYPVEGWWKKQKKRDRSESRARYALVVSVETPGVEADVWTPVAQELGVGVGIRAESRR